MRLALLSVMVLTAGCSPTVSDRPCPRVTEFPAAVQDRVRAELHLLGVGSATGGVMDTLAADREFNRVICAPSLFRGIF